MATNFAISATPATINLGETSTITVTCSLNPGGPITVTLSMDNEVVSTGQLTLSAEQFPPIKIQGDPAIGPGDYVIATDQGTLTATAAPGVFTLQE